MMLYVHGGALVEGFHLLRSQLRRACRHVCTSSGCMQGKAARVEGCWLTE